MQSPGRILFLTLAILALAVIILTRYSAGDDDGKKVETKKLPLDSIYSTNRQKGLKVVDQGRDEAYDTELKEIYRHSLRMGASNVFLARGDDITAAVKATWEVFASGFRVDKPVSLDNDPKSVEFWLVGYLGVAGSGPAWLVKSVEVSDKEIRLAYSWIGTTAHDRHPYFAWAPLGKLEAGTYTLELFDVDRQQITLLRRVTVPEK